MRKWAISQFPQFPLDILTLVVLYQSSFNVQERNNAVATANNPEKGYHPQPPTVGALFFLLQNDSINFGLYGRQTPRQKHWALRMLAGRNLH